MSAITISPPHAGTERGWPAITATVDVQGRKHEVYFRSQRGPLSASAAPYIMSVLPVAMQLGLPVQAPGSVAASFMDYLERTQRLFRFFFPTLHHVDIAVSVAQDEAPHAAMDQRGAGLFFSGGVDSFYSLLKHQAEVTQLIYVHGFDTLLANPTARALNARALRHAAAEAGKQFFELETNVRSMIDPYQRWLHPTATSVQFAIALTVMPQFHTIFVAENYPYSGEWSRQQEPTVPGAAGPAVVFDGVDAMRLEKIQSISSSPLAMRWLRVCWQNLGVTYNCGRCEKCLRTMIGLEIAGALDSCRTFTNKLDIERVRTTDLDKFARFWPELALALDQSGAHPELAAAIRDSVRSSSTEPYRWQRMIRHLEERGDRPELVAVVREFLAYSEAPAEQRQQAIKLREARARIIELERELSIVTSSSSWRMTAPLRALGRRVRGWRAGVR